MQLLQSRTNATTFAPCASIRVDLLRADVQCPRMLQMMPAASRTPVSGRSLRKMPRFVSTSCTLMSRALGCLKKMPAVLKRAPVPCSRMTRQKTAAHYRASNLRSRLRLQEWLPQKPFNWKTVELGTLRKPAPATPKDTPKVSRKAPPKCHPVCKLENRGAMDGNGPRGQASSGKLC